MRNTVIVVPALNPDDKFLKLLAELKENGFTRMIVVDDGSRPEQKDYFAQAQALGAHVLTHAVNLGKGRALKTAFNYILNTYGVGVQAVCADADGQHRLPDIIAAADKLAAAPDKLIMGCRDFNAEGIPFRSRFGNKLTRFVFRLLCGVRVSDTQTGLRGLSGKSMEKFMQSHGERFEYEMNMLIDARDRDVEIAEVPISTIYIAENETSHFNPLRDSARIYSVFLKFILSSLGAFLIDYLLFCLFSLLFDPWMEQTASIFLSTFLARAASSFTNYCINKKKVFRVEERRGKTMVRYYILCLAQMLASAGLVNLLLWLLNINKAVVKPIVDFALFLVSFQIQREWVFRQKGNRK